MRNPGDVEVRVCKYWFRSSFQCAQGFAGLLPLHAGGYEHRGAVIYILHYANCDILKVLYSCPTSGPHRIDETRIHHLPTTLQIRALFCYLPFPQGP